MALVSVAAFSVSRLGDSLKPAVCSCKRQSGRFNLRKSRVIYGRNHDGCIYGPVNGNGASVTERQANANLEPDFRANNQHFFHYEDAMNSYFFAGWSNI